MVFGWAEELLAMKRDMELVKSTSFSAVSQEKNYDSIKDQEIGSQLSLLLQESIHSQTSYPLKEKKNRQLRKHMIVTCSFILGSLMVAMMVTLFSSQPSFHFNIHTRVVDLSKHPFSKVSPVDLSYPLYPDRGISASPHVFTSFETTDSVTSSSRSDVAREEIQKDGPTYPTNAWYENFLLFDPNQGYTANNQVYTLPYILDTSGPVSGLRLNLPTKISNDQVVTMYQFEDFGVIMSGIGWEDGSEINYNSAERSNIRYDLSEPPGELGLVLRYGERDEKSMSTPIVRGMPYGTMIYEKGLKPSIFSSSFLRTDPVIDGKEVKMTCSNSSAPEFETNSFLVDNNVKLHFDNSDFTWIVFFSHPVHVYCVQDYTTNEFQLIADNASESDTLVVRLALLDSCTSGGSSYFCEHSSPEKSFVEQKEKTLKEYAYAYPYSPSVHYLFERSNFETVFSTESTSAIMKFDWDVRDVTTTKELSRKNNDHSVLMYALDHQIKEMTNRHSPSPTRIYLQDKQCEETLHGQICLVIPRNNTDNTVWSMYQNLTTVADLGKNGFTAPRPPHYSLLPSLVEALSSDIHYKIPDNYKIGAGDTYYSGKMLAKLGRILVIARELKSLCSGGDHKIYSDEKKDVRKVNQACQEVKDKLPSDEDIQEAVDELKSGVEIWINGEAESPFAYDSQWGGLVNCGCNYDDGHCDNVFPDCPALGDPGANFGQGFYNDHHFHQGYHVYAAAILTSFDASWGRDHFENVIAIIRDFANPSSEDTYFPTFRHKDWFLGSSWASGIATLGGNPYANGRNQESSSEAIAAYEGIGMYGAIMVEAWKNGNLADAERNDNIDRALNIRDIGRLLTATEINAARRYWHVTHDEHGKNSIYPETYSNAAVGMLWNTMAQFQTWFGTAPFLVYGIQLLPITPISEAVYDYEWVEELYPSLEESCEASEMCTDQGWSVLQYSALAVLGKKEQALEKALTIPDEAFMAAGGNGHSMTNVIWFISTRPEPMNPSTKQEKTQNPNIQEPVEEVQDDTDSEEGKSCAPCSKEACAISQCPLDAPFICEKGLALGGCSPSPWNIKEVAACTSCCDVKTCG